MLREQENGRTVSLMPHSLPRKDDNVHLAVSPVGSIHTETKLQEPSAGFSVHLESRHVTQRMGCAACTDRSCSVPPQVRSSLKVPVTGHWLLEELP